MTLTELKAQLAAGRSIKCRTKEQRYIVMDFLDEYGFKLRYPPDRYRPDVSQLTHPYIYYSPASGTIQCSMGAGCLNPMLYRDVKPLILNARKAAKEEFETAFAELMGGCTA